jgi:hypothetical protein
MALPDAFLLRWRDIDSMGAFFAALCCILMYWARALLHVCFAWGLRINHVSTHSTFDKNVETGISSS